MTARPARFAVTSGRISTTSARCFATSRSPKAGALQVRLSKAFSWVVVTDAGGFGVLLADSVDTYKMNLTDFSPETIKKFRATFPPFYACSNPMDLTGSVKTHEFIEAAKLALDDPNVDSVIFAYQPGAPGLELPLEMAKTIEKNFGPGKTKKPFIVLEFGGKYPDDDVIRDYLKQVGMSVYEFGLGKASSVAGRRRECACWRSSRITASICSAWERSRARRTRRSTRS